jgi:hypothetical protein
MWDIHESGAGFVAAIEEKLLQPNRDHSDTHHILRFYNGREI